MLFLIRIEENELMGFQFLFTKANNTMPRLRKIMKYGDSFVIVLRPVDMIDLGWKLEDYVDIEDIVFKKGKNDKQ